MLTKEIDASWTFADKTQKETAYITHSYYTYPAKFIPQLANRLIKLYSNENDIILDPFMGSGTTIVESLVTNRKTIGIDINEIAYLISQVKAIPLSINVLKKEYSILADKLSTDISLFQTNIDKKQATFHHHERIDFWFKPKQKKALTDILINIFEITDKNIQNFYLVVFAQILKSSSIWLQKSIKPTRDLNKKEVNVYDLFFKQARNMIKKQENYNDLLSKKVKENIADYLTLHCGDSRSLPINNEEIKLIVTSPPYVTSYEYADLHQLPSLWFGFLDSLSEFRKKFIGSSYKEPKEANLQSKTAEQIIKNLKSKKAKEVKGYYIDMFESFCEMHRVLQYGGKACIVIGNTTFQGVDILNAEVFVEQMQNIGFRIFDVIHREIPSKMLPSTRDSSTGRFAKTKDSDKVIYPTEYILVMEKI